MESDQFAEWLSGYRQAWETTDPKAAGELFTADAQYRVTPFETLDGRDAIRDYWATVTEDQRDTQVETDVLGVADGRGFGRFVAEWTNPSGAAVTLDGVCVVRLEDGQCTEFREWWHRDEA